MKLSFTKMQGCANDYIYLDCRESGVPENIVPLARDLSRRHFSVGADGIICICAPVTPGADGRMRIFNADGSEAQMCGNGVRCVAEWLYTHGVAKPRLAIDTGAGCKTVTRMGERLWQVEMGEYTTMAAAMVVYSPISTCHSRSPIRVTVLQPAPVSMASRGFATPWVYSHSATQRTPLPHICASLPSALKMRIRPSAPGVTGAQMQMMPSAPTEKCRRDRSRASGTMFSGTPLSRQSR